MSNESGCVNPEHVLCSASTLTCFCEHHKSPIEGCVECKFGTGKMTEPDKRKPDWCAYCGYDNPPYETTQINPSICIQCGLENAHVEEPKYVDAPKIPCHCGGSPACELTLDMCKPGARCALCCRCEEPRYVIGKAKQTKEVVVSKSDQFCRHGNIFTCVECTEFNQAVFKKANPHLIVGVDHSDTVDAFAMAIHAARAVKFDDEKHRYDLIPPRALDSLAEVLTYGAKKYSERNWEKGMRYGRLFAAAMRHLWAFWRGEEYDPESGLQHLAHAAVCVIMILDYRMTEIGEDDRPCTSLTKSNRDENKSSS